MKSSSLIGAAIRTNRIAAQLSQQTLADITNVSRVFINNIENGKRVPSQALVERLASVFGKDGVDLIEEAQQGEVNEKVELAIRLKRLASGPNASELVRRIDDLIEALPDPSNGR